MKITKEILGKVFNQSPNDENMFMFQDGRFNIGSSYAKPYMCIIRHDTSWWDGLHQDYFKHGFPWKTTEGLADFFEEQMNEMKLESLMVIVQKLREI